MPNSTVVVIDYGAGNLRSVVQALEYCGSRAVCTSDPQIIATAKKILLPGVGAFSKAMEELHSRRLVEPIRQVASKGLPIMGICLGMQLLLDESEEFGITQGLGIIPGKVVSIPKTGNRGKILKMPSIGWYSLIRNEKKDLRGSILENYQPGEALYFLHSFMAVPNESSARLADYQYENHRITAVIKKDQITGCQFHPEKSGTSGLKLFKKFCEA